MVVAEGWGDGEWRRRREVRASGGSPRLPPGVEQWAGGVVERWTGDVVEWWTGDGVEKLARDGAAGGSGGEGAAREANEAAGEGEEEAAGEVGARVAEWEGGVTAGDVWVTRERRR